MLKLYLIVLRMDTQTNFRLNVSYKEFIFNKNISELQNIQENIATMAICKTTKNLSFRVFFQNSNYVDKHLMSKKLPYCIYRIYISMNPF